MNEPHEIFDDGVMRAELIHDGWLFIRWLNNTIGHFTKKLVKDFKMMETLIQKNGWKGWLMNSEKGHHQMHKILKKVGGKQYDEDSEYVYFMKEFNHVRI